MYKLYKYPILEHANGMVGGSDGSSDEDIFDQLENELLERDEDKEELQELYASSMKIAMLKLELYSELSSPELYKTANIVMGRAAIRGVKYDPVEYVKFKKGLGKEEIPGENKFKAILNFAQKIFSAGFTSQMHEIVKSKGKNSEDVMLIIQKIIERKIDKDFPPGSQISIELHGPPPPPSPPPAEDDDDDDEDDEDEDEAPVPDNQAVLRIGSDGKFHRYEPGPALEQARAKPARRDLPQISFVSMGAHIGDK